MGNFAASRSSEIGHKPTFIGAILGGVFALGAQPQLEAEEFPILNYIMGIAHNTFMLQAHNIGLFAYILSKHLCISPWLQRSQGATSPFSFSSQKHIFPITFLHRSCCAGRWVPALLLLRVIPLSVHYHPVHLMGCEQGSCALQCP